MRKKRAPIDYTTPLAEAMATKRGTQPLRELALELGESHATLSYVEHGRMPRPAVFVKLLIWLGVVGPKTAEKLQHLAQEKRYDSEETA